ncbi:hypothetical protein F4780DRAFT_591887 [Xylariomycetidae sp. FL0641]|nr:hypothetical protein F4780DRAFT_591887 [Xylariomycetidae sp. FL0641]
MHSPKSSVFLASGSIAAHSTRNSHDCLLARRMNSIAGIEDWVSNPESAERPRTRQSTRNLTLFEYKYRTKVGLSCDVVRGLEEKGKSRSSAQIREEPSFDRAPQATPEQGTTTLILLTGSRIGMPTGITCIYRFMAQRIGLSVVRDRDGKRLKTTATGLFQRESRTMPCH